MGKNKLNHNAKFKYRGRKPNFDRTTDSILFGAYADLEGVYRSPFICSV